jgi:hypothetical protein
MNFNECSTCGAKDGRCGLMITTKDHGKPECLNCHDTRKSGKVVIHSNLSRTNEELEITMSILND